MANTLVLLDGEQAFVVNGAGQPINFKIGDGTKTFAELPFWIQYDQGQYVAVTGYVLPTPQQDLAYTMVFAGTYTHWANTITVPSGNIAVLYLMGSSWVKVSEMNIRGQDGTNAQSFNFKGNVTTYANLPSSGNMQNDAWYNLDDELLYVYNGNAWPADGEGIKAAATGEKPSITTDANGWKVLDYGWKKVYLKYGQSSLSLSLLKGVRQFSTPTFR